jgi:hypothetical protein
MVLPVELLNTCSQILKSCADMFLILRIHQKADVIVADVERLDSHSTNRLSDLCATKTNVHVACGFFSFELVFVAPCRIIGQSVQ